MNEEKIKNLYPFQYYTFKNFSVIKPYLNKYMFKTEHENELYIGNINGLLTMGEMLPIKMLNYFKANKKAIFILPENYREIIDGLTGFREQVLKIIDYYIEKQIKIITYKVGSNDFINKIKELKNMPKFDVCIGNPPFAGKGNPLYLRILEVCNEFSKNIVWICPTQWVKNYKDNAYLNNVKTNTCKNLIAHYHISNPFNDAIVANEIGIYIFGKAEQYEDYNEIRWERFNNIDLAKSICKKFESYKDNLKNHVITDNSEEKLGFWVNNSRIRGNQDLHTNKPKWDWTTLFGKEQHSNFKFDKNLRWNHWQFNSEVECKNFINTTETDICMFAYYITKLNNNCCPEYFELMPWFNDYTHEWTEEMIAKELGLSEDEVDYIHKEMKDFGWKAASKK